MSCPNPCSTSVNESAIYFEPTVENHHLSRLPPCLRPGHTTTRSATRPLLRARVESPSNTFWAWSSCLRDWLKKQDFDWKRNHCFFPGSLQLPIVGRAYYTPLSLELMCVHRQSSHSDEQCAGPPNVKLHDDSCSVKYAGIAHLCPMGKEQFRLRIALLMIKP